jgi:hypothetical protein
MEFVIGLILLFAWCMYSGWNAHKWGINIFVLMILNGLLGYFLGEIVQLFT